MANLRFGSPITRINLYRTPCLSGDNKHTNTIENALISPFASATTSADDACSIFLQMRHNFTPIGVRREIISKINHKEWAWWRSYMSYYNRPDLKMSCFVKRMRLRLKVRYPDRAEIKVFPSSHWLTVNLFITALALMEPLWPRQPTSWPDSTQILLKFWGPGASLLVTLDLVYGRVSHDPYSPPPDIA